MTVLVLLGSLLAFRGLGALGVRRWATWPDSGAHALALMLLMTASAHFAPGDVTTMPNHDDLEAMVPSAVPFASAVVYLTGALELLGAVGLVLERTRRAAGVCLALLFVAMLPANVHAALEGVELAGDPATPLWQRIPEQVLYVGVALWPSARAGRQVDSAADVGRSPARNAATST